MLLLRLSKALSKDAVLEGGHLAADLAEAAGVDFGDRHTGLAASIGQNHAPGIDDHGVAVGLAAIVVNAGLGGRNHVSGVFDGAGLNQYLPVVLAGVGRKGRRHKQHLSSGFRQMAVELREAHVIAN